MHLGAQKTRNETQVYCSHCAALLLFVRHARSHYPPEPSSSFCSARASSVPPYTGLGRHLGNKCYVIPTPQTRPEGPLGVGPSLTS